MVLQWAVQLFTQLKLINIPLVYHVNSCNSVNKCNYENNQSFFVQCINTTEVSILQCLVAYGTNGCWNVHISAQYQSNIGLMDGCHITRYFNQFCTETHDEGPSHTWVQWQTALPVEGWGAQRLCQWGAESGVRVCIHACTLMCVYVHVEVCALLCQGLVIAMNIVLIADWGHNEQPCC